MLVVHISLSNCCLCLQVIVCFTLNDTFLINEDGEKNHKKSDQLSQNALIVMTVLFMINMMTKLLKYSNNIFKYNNRM